MIRRTRRFVFARGVVCSAVALAILGAGCDRAPKGEGPYGDIVARVVPRLESQTGLEFKTPPKVETRTRDEVREFVMKQLSSERARTMLAGQQSLYRVLGLVPDTLDVAALLQRLLEEQIVGYYDPATKVLYVVDGAPRALLEQTVAHELVHALQDQYVRIDSIQASVDDADRQTAAQAVLEGQAVFEQLRVDPNTGPMLKMPGGWDRIRDVIRNGQGNMPVFASAPRAIRESLLFPYLGGADFVRRFLLRRDAGDLLADLPISTRQILDDSAYFGSTREVPTQVTLPSPRTGTVTYTNTLGEFETRLVLVQHLNDEALARRGASGVHGDRVSVVRTSAGDAVVWASVWDSAVEAGDFLDLLTDAIRRRYGMARPEFAAGETHRRLQAPAEGTRGARVFSVNLVQVSGRPVVLFTDAPAAIGDALIDANRITLSN